MHTITRLQHGFWALAVLFGGCVFAVPAVAGDSTEPVGPTLLAQPTDIDVTPSKIELLGRRGRQQILVTGIYATGQVRDLSRVATVSCSNPDLVTIENGVVRARSNGTATLTVRAGGHERTLEVSVQGAEKPQPISFKNEVIAALSKAGCSSGACHGSPSGKNGFRLSLFGHEPEFDFEMLTHEYYGRRVDPMDPAESLMLRKPTMQVAHGGGRRITKGDVLYNTLHNWIAEGRGSDLTSSATVERIEVFPEQRILHRPALDQQLMVLAHYSDGTVRDITPLANYTASNESIATVNADGLVEGQERGEVAVLVRYLDKMANAHLMFLEDVPGFAWNNPPENNYVDTHVFNKLKQLQILPSELCTDEEFVRRAYLDAIGTLPTAEEARRFLEDTSADKRDRLVDALLQRSEYADLWALRWADILRSNRKAVSVPGIHKFQKWIRDSIRDDKPLDQFARELLTSTGSTFDNPAANYYRTARDPNDATETTAQLFLGVRIQCAKCHNHPFERWTQDNYYGIAAIFARVKQKKGPEADEEVIFVSRSGEVTQPRSGKQMVPYLPLTGDADVAPGQDRRQVFADWLTSADNPFFARMCVNRIWGHLMGRGIVEPVDDFRDSNPPSNEALLDALAKDFVKSGYSRKHLIRTIMTSRVYQLSSRKNGFNKDDEFYFSHANVRLLPAEQLLDAICAVTDVPEQFPGLPAGTRSIELPDPKIDNYFLKIFGQPQREMACECERSSESNLSQALQMINGPTVHNKLRSDQGRIKRMMDAGRSDEEIIHALYLAALSRLPADSELEAATKHIAGSPDRKQALEDVGWALLNCKEFLFQH